MKLRTCKKCSITRPLAEFYKHHYSADGRMTKCMECTKADARDNRRKRIEYYRAYDRERGNRQEKAYLKGYRQKNTDKYIAHNTVNNAIRDGKLSKLDACEHCGSDKNIVGHHVAYDLPLCVAWLCQACHVQLHKEFEMRQRKSA